MKRPGNRALLLCALAALGGACGQSPEPITIRAGLLLDGRGGQLRDALVTVVDGRIRAVGAWQPAGAPVTHDLSRYTVLPGLIDVHVHISGYFNPRGKIASGRDTRPEQEAGRAAVALATLRGGFTTVVSMGSENDKELRDKINAGSIPGPRILTSLTPFSDTSVTPAELRRMVRRLKRHGADFIKVFAANAVIKGGEPVFSAEQLAALCNEAKGIGLRAVVHAQSDASLQHAVQAGCGQVEHGFLATAKGLGALADRGVYFDPQCSLVIDNYLENWARFKGIRGYDSAGFVYMEGMRPLLLRVFRTTLATPRLKLLYGTDATAGAHGRNAEDLVCQVRKAGQAPMEALVTATSRNAGALGLGEQIGTIAPGYQADLIALDGNPLQEIEAVRRVKFVMKGGRVFGP